MINSSSSSSSSSSSLIPIYQKHKKHQNDHDDNFSFFITVCEFNLLKDSAPASDRNHYFTYDIDTDNAKRYSTLPLYRIKPVQTKAYCFQLLQNVTELPTVLTEIVIQYFADDQIFQTQTMFVYELDPSSLLQIYTGEMNNATTTTTTTTINNASLSLSALFHGNEIIERAFIKQIIYKNWPATSSHCAHVLFEEAQRKWLIEKQAKTHATQIDSIRETRFEQQRSQLFVDDISSSNKKHLQADLLLPCINLSEFMQPSILSRDDTVVLSMSELDQLKVHLQTNVLQPGFELKQHQLKNILRMLRIQSMIQSMIPQTASSSSSSSSPFELSPSSQYTKYWPYLPFTHQHKGEKNNNTTILLSPSHSVITQDLDTSQPLVISAKGGMLCDEVGFGKTFSFAAFALVSRSNRSVVNTDNAMQIEGKEEENEKEIKKNDTNIKRGKRNNRKRKRGMSDPLNPILVSYTTSSAAALIVCPSHLVRQWKQELHKAFKLIDADVIAIDMTRDFELYGSCEQFSNATFVIVSSSFLCNTFYRTQHPPQQFFHSTKWHILAVDEAHEINDSQLRSILHIQSTYRWYISGTPVPSAPIFYTRVLPFLQIEFQYKSQPSAQQEAIHQQLLSSRKKLLLVSSTTAKQLPKSWIFNPYTHHPIMLDIIKWIQQHLFLRSDRHMLFFEQDDAAIQLPPVQTKCILVPFHPVERAIYESSFAKINRQEFCSLPVMKETDCHLREIVEKTVKTIFESLVKLSQKVYALEMKMAYNIICDLQKELQLDNNNNSNNNSNNSNLITSEMVQQHIIKLNLKNTQRQQQTISKHQIQWMSYSFAKPFHIQLVFYVLQSLHQWLEYIRILLQWLHLIKNENSDIWSINYNDSLCFCENECVHNTIASVGYYDMYQIHHRFHHFWNIIRELLNITSFFGNHDYIWVNCKQPLQSSLSIYTFLQGMLKWFRSVPLEDLLMCLPPTFVQTRNDANIMISHQELVDEYVFQPIMNLLQPLPNNAMIAPKTTTMVIPPKFFQQLFPYPPPGEQNNEQSSSSSSFIIEQLSSDWYKPLQFTLDDKYCVNASGESMLQRCGSKCIYLMHYLQTQLKENPDARFLVFSRFSSTLNTLRKIFRTFKMNTLVCQGNVVSKNKAIHDFQHNKDTRLLLLSAEQAASGLNLQFACHVIILDGAQDVTALKQQLGRAWRIGQNETVHLIIPVIANSLETDLLSLSI